LPKAERILALAIIQPERRALENQAGKPLARPPGQFLERPVEINVLSEPVKGDFHRNK
jgi:hypothetical protein